MFGLKREVTGQQIKFAIEKIISKNPYIGAVINGEDETIRQAMAQLALSAFDKDVTQAELNALGNAYLDEFIRLRAVHRSMVILVVIYILEHNLFLSDAPLERLTTALYQTPHVPLDGK